MAHNMVQATIDELTLTGDLIGKAGSSITLSGPLTVVGDDTTLGGTLTVTGGLEVGVGGGMGVMPVYGGKSTVENDADAAVVITVTGALAASDFAQAQLIAATADVYVEKTVVTNDTVTVTLSGNGGVGTQVSYVVYRPVV